jgi:diguanylate cyclase (GGDEF)-like protein
MEVSMTEGEARKGENERLAALKSYDILDTPPEEAFDRITRLARTLLRVPIITVTFIDDRRQWFKSRQGMAASETPRETAFCNEAIKHDGPFIVEDALVDPRFSENPSVTGEPHIRFYGSVPLRTRQGFNIGTLCAIDTAPRSLASEDIAILSDLAHIVMDELELRKLATTDSLTGALSRRAFREEATRDFALARRHRNELSCMVLDVDHFKRVNDGHGHAAGDAVLQGIVTLCNRSLRASDYVGRLGGEEFGIVLPQTSGKAAMEAAERLRRTVEQHVFETPAGKLKVTISLGVAPCDKSVADIDALLRRCDVALYGAKSAGRNRAVNFATQHLSPVPRVA